MSKTLEILRAKIGADLARECAQQSLFGVVRKLLERFEGKPNNARLVTALKKAFPTSTVTEVHSTGIKIYGGKLDPHFSKFEDAFYFWMPSRITFTLAEFDATNTCYGEAAIRRIADRRTVLEYPHILDAVAKEIDAYNEAYRAVVSLTEPGCMGQVVHYHALRLMEGTEYFKRAKLEGRS